MRRGTGGAADPEGGRVGLLVGVYPANVQMAVDAMAGDKPTWKALTLARLPLQWPMIRAMWRTARG